MLLSFLCLILFSNALLAVNQYIQQDGAQVTPLFSCWFLTYNTNTPDSNNVVVSYKNIILGYSSSYSDTQIIGVTNSNINASSINNIQPMEFNGQQPTVFITNGSDYSIVINDIDHVLDSLTTNNFISWNINNITVTVRNSDLTEETRCITKYPTSCSTTVDHFCEDSSYCNGREICYQSLSDPNLGTCTQTTEVIACNSNSYCNDTTKTCDLIITDSPTISPTNTPTTSPTTISPTNTPTTNTPTSSPTTNTPTDTNTTNTPTTNTPTTKAPTTKAPTSSPTVVIVFDTCVNDSDCSNMTSFCNGNFTCNTTSSLCVKSVISYDPCQSQRDELALFYNETNATTFPISIICRDNTSECIQSFTCTLDIECSDHLVCNGIEKCINGSCHANTNQTIASVCNTTLPMVCIEPIGCMLEEDGDINVVNETDAPTVAPTSAPTHHSGLRTSYIVVIVLGVIALVGMAIMILILYFEFTTNDSYTPSMTYGNTVGLSSRVRGNVFNKKYGIYHND